MAILFDWYEDPKPSDKQQGENENTLHPRIKYNGSTGTDVLRRRIQAVSYTHLTLPTTSRV